MRTVHLQMALRPIYAFDREASIGVAKCAHTYGNVFLHLKHPDQTFGVAEMDGLIVSTSNPRDIQEVAALGIPVVNVANYLEAHDRVPVVGNDDAGIGQMIARYYLDRGFKSFAYYADVGSVYFNPRRDAFVAAVERAGFTCHLGPPMDHVPRDGRAGGVGPGGVGAAARRGHVGGAGAGTGAAGGGNAAMPGPEERGAAWLASLPRPLAVMAPFDAYARQALHSCKLAGLRVPEEVSIIGVDDDPLMCLTIWPQMSSVATSANQIGRAAMDLLLAMIEGAPAPKRPVLLPPSEIVVRGSTSELAIDDPDVAAAVNFIRTHVRGRLTVTDITNHLAISRRTLERKFADTLERTPLEEIRRARVAQAKRLLIDTDLSLPEVARRSGLIRPQRLSNLIRAETGVTPAQFRAQFRRG
ncbi:MAG TPA: substrate-binding domain-containing protein [Tepidisphaeraceae bacterium]|nr:substrate-binding domain-containing protein [Tepidisphaeraceae bacterium]